MDTSSGVILNDEQDFATFHNAVIGGCLFCQQIWARHAEANKDIWAALWRPASYLHYRRDNFLMITYAGPRVGRITTLTTTWFHLFPEDGKIMMLLCTGFSAILVTKDV